MNNTNITTITEQPTFTPVPYTCYSQTYYLNHRCEFCSFKNFALCEYNGYKTKELKQSTFEAELENQEKLDKAIQNGKVKSKNKTSGKKGGRKK